jgi:hypothetical protein
MHWWNRVLDMIRTGDLLFTPGVGIDGGNRKRPFCIHSTSMRFIEILSGKAFIKLEKACFDVIEEAFHQNKSLWLRCASIKANEPLENSADKLIRERTGSRLARGNYVCSILEKAELVTYSMRRNKKCIELKEPEVDK